jgi:hypothetical protein
VSEDDKQGDSGDDLRDRGVLPPHSGRHALDVPPRRTPDPVPPSGDETNRE